MTQEKPTPLPEAGPGHYLALCVVCLALIFWIQFQAGFPFHKQIDVAMGLIFLATKMWAGPILLVIMVAAVHLAPGQLFGDGPFFRDHEAMKVTDVLLCAAVLGYVVGHYRLQSIWYKLLPPDTRQRVGTPRRVFPWFSKKAPILEEKRSPGQITPQEIAWLVVSLPVWAVIAQVVMALLPQNWHPLELPTPLLQILLLLWLLTLGFFLVRALLGFWKHRSHDPATAQLYLQDLLWRETRPINAASTAGLRGGSHQNEWIHRFALEISQAFVHIERETINQWKTINPVWRFLMRFWIRELAGWLLIGMGLYVFLACYAILVNQGPHLIEAGPLTFIGFVVFRGGIQLLKVATAARICLHAQTEIVRRQNPPKEAAKRPALDFDW